MLVAALWAPIDANMVGLAMSTGIVLVQPSEEMKLVVKDNSAPVVWNTRSNKDANPK